MELNPKKGAGIRRIDCEQYGKCLGIAARESWKNFNCESCSGKEHGIMEIIGVQILFDPNTWHV